MSSPSDLFPITSEDEIVDLEREIKLRKRVYPRWVVAGRFTQEKADRQIALLESLLARVKTIGAKNL